MERLTAEDQLMLWPDRIWPQDIGALAVLDATSLLAPDGSFRVEAVRRAIEARLHLVPRFRQLLYVPRRGLGRPLWVDAPAFDLNDHVRVAPLAAPGGEAALLVAVRHPVSVTTADVPGPPRPVHLAGARLLEAFPVLPLIFRTPLAVGALSYAGQFNVSVVADADACPDLDVFVAAAREELRALAESTSTVDPRVGPV